MKGGPLDCGRASWSRLASSQETKRGARVGQSSPEVGGLHRRSAGAPGRRDLRHPGDPPRPAGGPARSHAAGTQFDALIASEPLGVADGDSAARAFPLTVAWSQRAPDRPALAVAIYAAEPDSLAELHRCRGVADRAATGRAHDGQRPVRESRRLGG